QGDGVVMLFGWPANQGGNADRAVGAGLALQADLSSLSHGLPDGSTIAVAARVGITSGDAVVGRIGGAAGHDGLQLVGPAVNRAARLQALAAPGTVVVDDATRSLVVSACTFRRLPDALLKGFDRPVPVSQALPPGRAPHRGGTAPAQPLPRSGHLREAALLAEAWQAARAGHTVLVRLSGEAGIGKSTLMADITATAEAEGARVLRLACAAVATHMPLRPVIDLLEAALPPPAAAAPEARLAALQALPGMAGADDLAPVASLLGLPVQTAGAGDERARLLGTLARFLMDAGDRPGLIAVEDLHWADATTRDLIQLCAAQAPARGAMIVVSSRHPDEPLWPGDARRRDVAVTPLAQTAARAVLAHHLGGRVLPDSIAEAILTRSDGNPLMLEALARSVAGRDDDALRRDFQVPLSIYDSISGRLDGLRLGRQAVAALAVFDEPTDAATLAHALGVPSGDLDDALAELEDTGIIAPAGNDPLRSLRFRHSLYREVGYERLVKSVRKALHKAVHAALTQTRPELEHQRPGLLAWHAAEAEDHATAAPLALVAGEQALTRSALIEASHFLRQALASLDRLERSRETDLLRLRVLTAQASISRARLGIASDEVGVLGQQIMALACDLGERRSEMIALNGLYAHALVRSEYPAAGRWAARLRDAAVMAQDRTFQMIGDRGLGVVAFHTGALAEAAVLLRQALDRYDEAAHLPLAHAHGYDHAEICAVFLSFTLWSMGDPRGADAVGAFSVSHSRRIGHAHSLAQALAFRAMLATLRRDTATAIACGQEAQDVGARHGLAAMQAAGVFFGLLGQLLAQDTPPDSARLAALRDSHAGFQKFNPYNYGPLTGTLLADIFLRAGDPALADATLRQAEAVQDRSGETWTRPELLRLRAQVQAAQGDAAALPTLHAALQAAESTGATMFALRIACDLALADPSPEARARVAALRGRMISATGGAWDGLRCQALLGAGIPA
ncbi:MAG TPA: AAA family ATPase, partial [Paracoccaceae bacterium]|nr:AAA family ATPase [Paracoccaceae bacterium]